MWRREGGGLQKEMAREWNWEKKGGYLKIGDWMMVLEGDD